MTPSSPKKDWAVERAKEFCINTQPEASDAEVMLTRILREVRNDALAEAATVAYNWMAGSGYSSRSASDLDMVIRELQGKEVR